MFHLNVVVGVLFEVCLYFLYKRNLITFNRKINE